MMVHVEPGVASMRQHTKLYVLGTRLGGSHTLVATC